MAPEHEAMLIEQIQTGQLAGNALHEAMAWLGRHGTAASLTVLIEALDQEQHAAVAVSALLRHKHFDINQYVDGLQDMHGHARKGVIHGLRGHGHELKRLIETQRQTTLSQLGMHLM